MNNNNLPLTMIVDGNALMNVFFHATSGNIHKNNQGVPIDAMALFVKYIYILSKGYNPQKFAIAFDTPGGTKFRTDAYPDYKAQRPEKDPNLVTQINAIQYWLRRCNIQVYTFGGAEADDIVASLASKESLYSRVMVVTTDHDYYQLVNDRIQALMYIPNAAKLEKLKAKYPNNCYSHFCLFDSNMVKAEEGVHPFQIPDLKGLSGDSSDNIKGVPGIGEKTAIQLMSMYGSVEDLLKAITESDDKERLVKVWNTYLGSKISKTVPDKLISNYQTALLCKWVATMQKSIPFEPIVMQPVNPQAWSELIEFVKKAS